jgi:Icc-related predicted phosphoesterase
LLKCYSSITYLENSGIEIYGIKVWGTPDQRLFLNWAFNRTDDQLKEIFGQIPRDTNILVSHAPALGIGDTAENGQQVGEESLLRRIEQMNYLKVHVFGHIHNGYDEYKVGKYRAYNCSVVNEKYELQNDPFAFEYSV